MNRNHLKSLSSQLGGAKRSRRTNGTRSAFATASFILAASLFAVLLVACPSTTPETDRAPGAPTIAKMVVGTTGQVTINWTASDDKGIPAEITKYTVYHSTEAITDLTDTTKVTKVEITGAETLTKDVTGLTDDTAYYFVVTATNATGESDASGARTATPQATKPAAAAPGKPTGVTATGGDKQVTVSWTAPVDTGYDDADGTVGAITKYTVYHSESAISDIGATGVTKVEVTTGLTTDVTGLTNGTKYHFVVTATNATGGSVASDEATATPALDDTAPTFTLSAIPPATGVTELTITADEAITLLGADNAANIEKLTVTNDVDGTATEVTVTKVALGADAMTVTITIDSTDFEDTKKVSVLIKAGFAADKAAPTANNNVEATKEVTVEPTKFTVSYDANTGTGTATAATVNDGDTIAAAPTSITKDGYTLSSWNTAADGTGTAFIFGTTTVTADITVYAQWTINQYTVTYNANTGDGTATAATVNHGDTIATAPTSITKDGHTLSSWNTAANGTGTAFIFGTTTVTADITLYAQWTLKPNAAPGAPTGVTATAGNAQVTVAWTAPADTGITGGDGTLGVITAYTVYHSETNDFTDLTAQAVTSVNAGTNLTTDVTGLTNATQYYFVVTATNDTGESAASDVKSATPTP